MQHHALLTAANLELNKLETLSKEDESYKKQKTEYKDRIEALKEQIKSFEDSPLMLDCVWFHDGSVWRAAIDKDGSGNLKNAKLLTDYHLEGEYDTFGTDSMLNFSVNFYDEGNVLSIVTTAGMNSS